jgi:acyl-coenzyme A thioesterase PaaI-like protein
MLTAVPFIARRGMQITHMRDGTARRHAVGAGQRRRRRPCAQGAVAALLDTAGAMASWSIVGLDFSYKASTVAIPQLPCRPPARPSSRTRGRSGGRTRASSTR